MLTRHTPEGVDDAWTEGRLRQPPAAQLTDKERAYLKACVTEAKKRFQAQGKY